jgi:TonB family protein
MKVILILSLLFMGLFCKAQHQNVYFLKNNGTLVKARDSADFIRVVREPDSASILYNVFEFYKNGKKRLIGKSSTIDPTKFEGLCNSFYENETRKSTINYKNGREVGDEFDFYPNGRIYQQITYPDNGDLYNAMRNNYLIKASYDSLGVKMVENGNGYYKGYEEDFKAVSEEGNIKDGKRDGLWKGDFEKRKIAFTEHYKDGDLIEGTATFEDGTFTSYVKTRGTPPEFKDGPDAFYKYLGNTIRYPYDGRRNNIQGRVVLSFIVEKDGKVNDIKVTRSVSPSIDAEAVRVMKNCPPWVAGLQFGRPVRVSYSVPIMFKLTN